MKRLDFPLDPVSISSDLGTRILGKPIVYLDRTGSTNDVAKELANAGNPEGTVVITDEQTAGRGRLGRSWVAPAYSSVLMSLLFRPKLALEDTGRITMAAALGTCDAVTAVTGLKPTIKWPNDILLNGRKCAGILAEASCEENQVAYVIIGIGINVNFSTTSVSGIAAEATTISDELKNFVSRELLIKEMLRAIEKYYSLALEGQDLHTAWAANLTTLHRQVTVLLPSGKEEGWAEDVDQQGALLLRRPDGSLTRVLAGDVLMGPR